MKKNACLLLVLGCLTTWVVQPAMSNDAVAKLPTQEARQQERIRLDAERQRLEHQYNEDVKACYQMFDVTRCRLAARDRRIEANQVLRQAELNFNAIERQVQAEETRARLSERNNEAARKDAEVQRAQAVAAARERSDAHAQKQLDHALVGTKRGEYEQKQREAAQHRADVEKKLRERGKEPAAPLPVPTQ